MSARIAAVTAAILALAATPASAPEAEQQQLSPAQAAGQRIVFGFQGTEPPRPLLRRIRRGEAAGVILFARNIRSRAQVRSMNATFQRWRPPGDPPLLVMVDQEGGIVKRLAGAPRRSAAELGRATESLARAEGRSTARNLRGVGINVNLAPVVDIGRPGRIMRAQGRAFSSSPARVTLLAGAFAAGLREGGVAACAKHFPGLGGARHDQDRRNNSIGLSAERLRSEDYAPYRALARQGVELVMTSTADYPALDPHRPAVFSPRILGDELRNRVGFRGVTVTDSLGVESASRLGSPETRAVRAVRAGNDLLLFASSYAAGVRGARALTRTIRSGDPAAERIAALRRGLH